GYFVCCLCKRSPHFKEGNRPGKIDHLADYSARSYRRIEVGLITGERQRRSPVIAGCKVKKYKFFESYGCVCKCTLFDRPADRFVKHYVVGNVGKREKVGILQRVRTVTHIHTIIKCILLISQTG